MRKKTENVHCYRKFLSGEECSPIEFICIYLQNNKIIGGNVSQRKNVNWSLMTLCSFLFSYFRRVVTLFTLINFLKKWTRTHFFSHVISIKLLFFRKMNTIYWLSQSCSIWYYIICLILEDLIVLSFYLSNST